MCWTFEVWQICCSTPVLGILLRPFSRKPQRPFQHTKPILVNWYLKIKKYVWREPLLWRICVHVKVLKQLWRHKVWEFVTAFQVGKLSGPLRNRLLGRKKCCQKHNKGIPFTNHWTTTHTHTSGPRNIFRCRALLELLFSVWEIWLFFPVESCNNSMYESSTTPNCSISFEEMLTHSIPRPPWHGYMHKLLINCIGLNVLIVSC